MAFAESVMLVLLGLIWGSSYLFIKLGVNEMPPAMVAGGRLVAGLLVLFFVVYMKKLRLPRDRAFWQKLAVVGFLNNTAPWLLIPWGEQHISSALASILNAAMPIFVVVLAHIATRDDRLTGPKLAGILLGFAGVVVLVGADLADLTGAGIQGEIAVLVSTLSYAMATVYARQHLRGHDHTVLATAQLTMGLLFVTPFMMLSAGEWHGTPSPTAIVAVAALGVLSSGIAYVIYYWLIDRLSASKLALTSYLFPVTALLWGVLLLNESVGPHTLTGLALILGGIFLVNNTRAAGAPAPATVER